MDDLPKGWIKTDLVNLVHYKKGKKPKTLSETQTSNTLPYLDIEAFVNNNIRQYADTESSKITTQEDILIVWDGARSGLAGLSRDGAIGSTIVALTPIAIEKLYLLYFIQSKYHYINDNHRGSGIPHVNPDVFWPLQVPLPPLNEQRRIVAKLEKLLAKVNACGDRLDKIPTILKRFRQSVLAAACSGRLTTDWREQHPDVEPAEELLKRIQEERLYLAKNKNESERIYQKFTENLISSEDLTLTWLTITAECLCDFITKGTTPKEISNTGEIPYLKVQHIVENKIDFWSIPCFTSKKIHDTQLKRSKVFPGDILMNIVGPPLNKVAIVPDEFPEWNINQALAIFRPIPSISSKYIKIVLSHEDTISEILKETRGIVGQSNISLEQCRNLLIQVPPIAEQEEIVRRVESLFQKCDQIEARYQKAKAYTDKLTQAILAKAFRGELVPQDPNDEPAEVLLERIKAEKAATAKPKKTTKKRGKKTSSPQQTIPGIEST